MKLENARAIIEVARDRGFEIVILPGPPKVPVLRPVGERPQFSEVLLNALQVWRLEIMEELERETPERNGAS